MSEASSTHAPPGLDRGPPAIVCPATALVEVVELEPGVCWVRFRWGDQGCLSLELARDLPFYFWLDRDDRPFWACRRASGPP